MAWLAVAAVCMTLAAVVLAWKYRKLKMDVYEFADQVEQNLDAVIRGEKTEMNRETEDSLLGKISEKLERADHILERRARENQEEKRQIQELISDISHQTKTPLANQKIYLEILRSKIGNKIISKEIDTSLECLEHQTVRLEFLFDSMVKMSRLETGIIQIRKEKEDLMETVGKAVSGVVPAAEKKGIVLAVETGSEVRLRGGGPGELLVPHDGRWTEEAVYNLLDNAVKYTEPGGKVTLAICQREIFTEIHVRDTGRGIPLEHQAQIFTRFYRELEVHDREGLGIGLYLTRKIAEMQGGYVEVHSEPGKGADFCIYLPNQKSGRQIFTVL